MGRRKTPEEKTQDAFDLAEKTSQWGAETQAHIRAHWPNRCDPDCHPCLFRAARVERILEGKEKPE